MLFEQPGIFADAGLYQGLLQGKPNCWKRRSKPFINVAMFPLPPNSATERPPGFKRRWMASTARSASFTQWRVALENTASKVSSSVNSRASPTSKRIAGYACRAWRIIAADWSTPVTCVPRSAILAVKWPVPSPLQNLLACFRVQQLQQIRRHLPDKRVLVVVESGSHFAFRRISRSGHFQDRSVAGLQNFRARDLHLCPRQTCV